MTFVVLRSINKLDLTRPAMNPTINTCFSGRDTNEGNLTFCINTLTQRVAIINLHLISDLKTMQEHFFVIHTVPVLIFEFSASKCFDYFQVYVKIRWIFDALFWTLLNLSLSLFK